MMKNWILALFVTVSVWGQTASEKVWQAAEQGRISESQIQKYLKMILDGRQEDLPSNLQSTIKDKCGFPIATYFQNHAPQALQRTATPMTNYLYAYTFPTVRGNRQFQFYFTDTGVDAISMVDANGNTIPDWIEEAAIAAERSYRYEIDTLGYREPLDFSIYGFYKMFFVNMDAYGVTYFDSLVTSNPPTYVTSMDIENDFQGFYTTGYEALRVTIAHEFHHAIQLAYVDRSLNDAWYYELTSTWMEDVVYDEVNDYVQYLSLSFGSPQRSLDLCAGVRCGYHIVQFDHMIEEKYGRNVIRSSWEKFISSDALTALDGALTEKNSSLKSEFLVFAAWNYFTGSRSSADYYPEGSSYPQVRTEFLLTARDTSVNRSLDHLGAQYFGYVLTDSMDAQISLSSDQSGLRILAIEYNPARGKNLVSTFGNATIAKVTGLLPGDSLTVIIANQNLTGTAIYSTDIVFTKSTGSSVAIEDVRMFPSPFVVNNATSPVFIRFKLGSLTDMVFEVFSTSGRMIMRRYVNQVSAGAHDGRFESEWQWDGKDTKGDHVPSGVYYYRLKGSGFEKTGKIAVVR